MVRRPSPAVFLHENLQNFLADPKADEKIKSWIQDMGDVLKENMLAGERIQKNKIPDFYIKHHGVENLFRYKHPEGFRSCYTLINKPDLGVCPSVLDIMSHPEYDRRFGYRTT